MTKYILAGGNDRASNSYWDNLRQTIGDLGSPKVLSCFFAEPREKWEEKFAGFEDFFKRAFGQNITRELAFPGKFREQVKDADIIYLHGGDDALLAHYMENYEDLAKMLEGKIVIGSSAGASFLSSKYWTCDWREIRQGSGLAPLNVIVHYGSDYGEQDARGPIDWEAARKVLQKATGPDSEVIALHEGEFVVFEQ